jgi:type 1 glutamine amidotransferase
MLFISSAMAQPARFQALVLYENGGHHLAYSQKAIQWLNQLASDSNFTIHYIQNVDSITDTYLSNYQLFIQLDYPPYTWKKEAEQAFTNYIENGKGGWIGFHHATLLGNFDGYKMWPWFSDFMGGIRFKSYIPTFANGQVITEDTSHPCMKSLPTQFTIENEEWYTYDRSPRPNVQVLASVNESSYQPTSNIKMGDHPVVWTNPKMKAKNVYIFMGQAPQLFSNKAYTTLFTNAIFWAAGR